MKRRVMTGIAAGMLIGAAATVMMMPQMDNRTRKKVNRIGRKMSDGVSDVLNNIIG